MKNTKDPFDFTPDFENNFDFNASFDLPEIVEPVSIEKVQEVVSKTLQSFKLRNENEKKRFEKATDSEYWICVCFQTREEKESFLINAGLIEYGDKYLDGHDVAKKLNIPFEKDQTGYSDIKIDKKLSSF